MSIKISVDIYLFIFKFEQLELKNKARAILGAARVLWLVSGAAVLSLVIFLLYLLF